MRRLLVVLLLVSLAGCVHPGEERYVVTLRDAAGSTVLVPYPVGPDGEVPKFVHKLEYQIGRGTFRFVETERGPALAFGVPDGGDAEVVVSARRMGVAETNLTLAAGDGTFSLHADGPARVTVVHGNTREPDCPEARLEAEWTEPGWRTVALATSRNCPT